MELAIRFKYGSLVTLLFFWKWLTYWWYFLGKDLLDKFKAVDIMMHTYDASLFDCHKTHESKGQKEMFYIECFISFNADLCFSLKLGALSSICDNT